MNAMRLLLPAIALLSCTCGPAFAADTDATPASRLSLKSARIEPAPAHAGRYTISGRFAAAESAGELREGGDFVLIGRFAKGNINCDAGTIFLNGFETP